MKASFKLHIIILSVVLFSGVYSYSQNYSEKDSTEFKRFQDSIIKYQNNLRPLIVYFKEILIVAEKAKDTSMIIQTLHLIGRNSQFIAEYYQSTEYFEKELELLRTIDLAHEKYNDLALYDCTEIEVLAQLGQNSANFGQIEKAFSFYDNCIEIANNQDLGFYKAVMPTIIGELHFTTGNYREALNKHKESYWALKHVKNLDEDTRVHNIGATILSMSDTYIELGQLDSAIWVLDEGIKEKVDIQSTNFKGRFIGARGDIYLEKKEYEKAIEYYIEAEELAFQHDSVVAPTYYSLQLAECYFNLGKYDQAIAKLEEGIILKKKRTKEIYLTEDYKLLAKIYKEAGNIEKSNAYYEKYIINQTALEKSKDTITSTFHNKEIQNLTKEKTTQKSSLLFIIGGISLVVLSLFFVIANLIREKKKNEKKFESLLAKLNVDNQTELEIVDTKDRVLEEKTSAEVNREITDQILKSLERLKEQEYFLKKECNSYNVAKKIKTNTSYLSKVINSHFQKNFNTYINDLRINYVILRLKNDSRFRSFSIQSIAEELGYKSADSFTKYFKLRTGLNPSFYIKQLQNLD